MKEIEFIIHLDYHRLNRLRVRLITENGELIDVMYQYESSINNKWIAIVRYDCAHGFFHRDIMMPNGFKEKKSIEIGSLKNASEFAKQDIKKRWEWYKEKYIKKLNNN